MVKTVMAIKTSGFNIPEMQIRRRVSSTMSMGREETSAVNIDDLDSE